MSTIIDPGVFRAYDVRGDASRTLSPDLAADIGRALATLVGRRRKARRIAVGRDCRLSSPDLRDGLVRGLSDSGAEVLDLGQVPSPVVYFAAHHLEADGAIVVTGSHNPPGDNGFKIMCGTDTLHSEDIQAIRHMIESRDFVELAGAVHHVDLSGPYLDAITSSLELGPRRPRVVVDAGNGAAGPLALDLCRRLGVETVALYCDMDGSFPNHHPDPTVEDNLADLKAAVADGEAEVGIAFDGDGDRIGVVDGTGRVLWGDQLMLLFGRSILAHHPGATFIGEVKCSQTLFDGLRRAGGNPIMWKVGHSLIKAKMKETGALLAGEMSGHIFFADRYFGFDDALYAAARLVELLSLSDQTLAELAAELPPSVATPEIRIACSPKHKESIVDAVADALEAHPAVIETSRIDGVRACFRTGWGLVRASNTGALLVMRAEAESAAALETIRGILTEAIERARTRSPTEANP